MFKMIRITVLLGILVMVGATALLNRWQSQSWNRTQVVTLFPINADGDPATERFLEKLDEQAFAALAPFFAQEARRHGLSLEQPVRVELGRQMHVLPPPLPRDRGPLGAISWSLRMRWWAWRQTPPATPRPDVRLYLMYHPADYNGPLPHSTGLEKGRMGLVHLFASRAQQGPNAVVIAHEALHTFGASDKYDPYTLMPVHPDGYAQPHQIPLLPQDKAELMAGRVPLLNAQARIPSGMREVVIGRRTAEEIGWVKAR